MTLRDSILETLRANVQFKYFNIEKDEEFDSEHHKGEVLKELQFYIGTNECSELLINQLSQLHGRNYVLIDDKRHPYELIEIYWRMQSIIKNEIPFKVFNRNKSKLFGKNILHVHHSKAFYLEDNHIRYFEKKYKNQKQLQARINEIVAERPEANPVLEIVYETLIQSMNWKYKTGEWLMFQKSDEKYYFIGLGLHHPEDNNDEILYEKIKGYLREDF